MPIHNFLNRIEWNLFHLLTFFFFSPKAHLPPLRGWGGGGGTVKYILLENSSPHSFAKSCQSLGLRVTL